MTIEHAEGTPERHTLFGYPVRLLIDLPDGEHDVSGCIEIHADPHGRIEINPGRLLNEVQVERRVRERLERQ